MSDLCRRSSARSVGVTNTEDDLLPGPPQAYLVTIVTADAKPVHEVMTADDFSVTAAAS